MFLGTVRPVAFVSILELGQNANCCLLENEVNTCQCRIVPLHVHKLDGDSYCLVLMLRNFISVASRLGMSIRTLRGMLVEFSPKIPKRESDEHARDKNENG